MTQSSPLRCPKVLTEQQSSPALLPQKGNFTAGLNNMSGSKSIIRNHSQAGEPLQTPGRRLTSRSGQIVNISNIQLAQSNNYGQDFLPQTLTQEKPGGDMRNLHLTQKFPLAQIHNPACNLNSLLQEIKRIQDERKNALMQFYSQRCMNITKQISECLQASEYDPMIQILKNSQRNELQIKQRLKTIVNNKLAIQRQVQIDQLSRDLVIIQTINQRLEKQLASAYDNADPSRLCVSMKMRDLIKQNDNLRDRLRRQRAQSSGYLSPRNGTLSPGGSTRYLKSPPISPTFNHKSQSSKSNNLMQNTTKSESNQVQSLKKELAQSYQQKQLLFNDVTAAKSKSNELQNQLFLSQQRTEQAGLKIQTLQVEIKTLRARVKSMEVENSKGSSRMFSMENQLIDSFKKQKQSYLNQIQGLHHKIGDMNKVMDRIPQLQHKILIHEHTIKTNEKRQSSKLKEADQKLKTLIFNSDKKQLALNKEINERENQISELKNEIGVVKKESQITLNEIKSDIDKNYLSKEQHVSEVERQIRFCQEKNQKELNNLLNKQREANEKLLSQCEENHTKDREHISQQIKQKDQQMAKTLHIRDQLIESLEFQKKVVERLERDIEQMTNDKTITLTKYEELKKHYENKRVQCDQYRKQIGDLKLDFRNKSEQNTSIRKDCQKLQNQLYMRTNQCGQKDAQILQARSDISKLKQEKQSLVKEKFQLVKEHSLQLIQKGNKNQIALNKAQEHTSRAMKDLQAREHELHSTLVKLNQAEELIEQRKKQVSSLQEQQNRMNQQNRDLLNKIENLQNQNTDVKRVIKGREMQLSRLQFNFTKFKKFFNLQVQREIESMRYNFKVMRQSVSHELVMMREQSQNLVRENVLNILSLQSQIKDKQSNIQLDNLADEWRDKYDKTVQDLQSQIDALMNSLTSLQDQLRKQKGKHQSQVRRLESLRMRAQQDSKCIDMERKTVEGRCARLNEDINQLKYALQNKKLELLRQKEHYEQILKQNDKEAKQSMRRVQNDLGDELQRFKKQNEQKLKEMQDQMTRLKNEHEKERYQDRKEMLIESEKNAENFKRIVRSKDAQIDDLNTRIHDLREQCDSRVGESSNVIKTLTNNMKSERQSAHKISEKLEKELKQSRSSNHYLKLDLQRKADQLERLCYQINTSRDKSSQLSQKIFQLNKQNSVLKSKIAHRDQSAKEEARVLNSILENGKRRNYQSSQNNRVLSDQRVPFSKSITARQLEFDSKNKENSNSDVKLQLANTLKEIEIQPLDRISPENQLQQSIKPDQHLKVSYPQSNNENELTFDNQDKNDVNANSQENLKQSPTQSLKGLRTPPKKSWVPQQLSPSGGLDNSQI